jgi:uncharacterized membrane protein YphA (DoxX/SURF4 family)
MKNDRVDRVDQFISEQMWRVGVPLLRFGLAVVFIWFGALKLTGASPAIELVTRTVYWFNPAVFVPILGWWEIAIGLCLAIPPLTRLGIFLLAFQMPGTFLPLVLLPQVCYNGAPWNLTLEGQYIVKNLVIIGAALVLGGLVRGHRAPGTNAEI